MDDRRFDDVARALGNGASRRRVLAGLAAGALGLLHRGRAMAQDDGSAACAAVLCLEGSRCCEICGSGTCVPIDRPCPIAVCAGEACGSATCGPGEFCCNESCGICAPLGGFCTAQFCGDNGGGFGIGQGVVTTDALNYRRAPGLGAGIIAVLAAGTAGGVLGGPIAADGYTWYQIGLPGYGPDGAAPGWAAGEFLTPA